jgi:hypothetical protein
MPNTLSNAQHACSRWRAFFGFRRSRGRRFRWVPVSLARMSRKAPGDPLREWLEPAPRRGDLPLSSSVTYFTKTSAHQKHTWALHLVRGQGKTSARAKEDAASGGGASAFSKYQPRGGARWLLFSLLVIMSD